TVGLVPGTLSGTLGYRDELRGQRSRLVRLGTASVLGGILGAALLLRLPASAFNAIVPVLIGVGCVLVVAQPWISAHIRPAETAPAHGSAVVWLLVLATGVYGGYFGAAQGVLLIAVLGLGLADTLQRINAAKNVLALLVNGVAAIVFLLVSEVSWAAVGLVAAGSIIGGQLGAGVGRRLPPPVLRGVVALIGVIAIVNLVFVN
ncbi:MAG TPA: sulfite exporter TauE/SafE family protein, partial [Pseudonocardiaceae bacterium]|nr:sulfite exporter TauE/SafE family protein [Pseudonocardiaceae bacterium]